MEPSGRNWWQEFCYVEGITPASLEQFVATCCQQLRTKFYGDTQVDLDP